MYTIFICININIYVYFYIYFLVNMYKLLVFTYRVNVCFILCKKCVQDNYLAILPLSSHALKHTSALVFFSL